MPAILPLGTTKTSAVDAASHPLFTQPGPYGYALNTDASGCGGYGAYGSAPPYSFAGACRMRRNHGHGGYVEARRIVPNGSMSRRVFSAKQAAYLDR